MGNYLTQKIIETYLFLLEMKERGTTKEAMMRVVEKFRKSHFCSEKTRDLTCSIAIRAIDALYADGFTREKYLEDLSNAAWEDWYEQEKI